MYGPWIPIYGFGGVFIVFLLDRFRKDKGKVFVLGIVLCAVLEYITSFILDFMFNSSYWDYKSEFLNINGRICFSGLIAFGIGGMAAVYFVAPAIGNFLSWFQCGGGCWWQDVIWLSCTGRMYKFAARGDFFVSGGG